MRIYAPLNSFHDPLLQEIEVATFFQIPSIQIIGLPSPEVAEARERIRSSIEASGLKFPKKRIVLNLSPASVRKRGTGLDLAMSLAILTLGHPSDRHLGAWGELGLDGTVKAAGQTVRAVYAAWKGGLDTLFLSQDELDLAKLAKTWMMKKGEFSHSPPSLVPVSTLIEAWKILSSLKVKAGSGFEHLKMDLHDFKGGDDFKVESEKTELRNKELLAEEIQIKNLGLMPLSGVMERILGVAVAGHHHLLLLGPRGTGKTHAIEWLMALQSEPEPQDWLKHHLIAELTGIHQFSHRKSSSLNFESKFSAEWVRRVGSTVRPAALTGGFSHSLIRPGECSLAHGGMLVADEILEWSRDSREVLREPLERGKVTVTRTQGVIEFPAQFLLAATGNLCPCGGWSPQISSFGGAWKEEDRKKSLGVKPSFLRCQCTDLARRSYLSRLSGPFLDRLDLIAFVTLPSEVPSLSLSAFERWKFLKGKVQEVQTQLRKSWGVLPGVLSGEQLEAVLQDHPLLRESLSYLSLSSLRARHKTLRLAMSLAAWDGFLEIDNVHLMEAASYRAERYFGIDEFCRLE